MTYWSCNWLNDIFMGEYYFVSLVHKHVFLLCLFGWVLEVSGQEHENKNEAPTLSLFFKHFSTTKKVSFNLSHLGGISLN